MNAGAAALSKSPSAIRTRLADYLALTKPRVAILILFTVLVGAWLAARGAPNPALLWHTLFGTALVVALLALLAHDL